MITLKENGNKKMVFEFIDKVLFRCPKGIAIQGKPQDTCCLGETLFLPRIATS